MVAALQRLASPGSPSFYADPERAAAYVRTLKEASKEAKQGNLEVVFGSVRFELGVGGTIAANARLRAFADQLGGAAAGGVALTYADANLFFGRCPSGQVIILQGLGLSIWGEEAPLEDHDVELLARNIFITMQLRNNPVPMGNLSIWPTEQGPRGTGNGNVDIGVRPFDPGVVLLPTEDYAMDFTAARLITTTLDEGQHIWIQPFHPATRIYDPRVLARI